MNTVRIQKIICKRTPWEVFQGVYAFYPAAFFLDSLSYQPPAQRYSYIGWNPFAEVRISNKKLYLVENKRKDIKEASQLWPVLRKLMRKYKPLHCPKVPFFTGGAVGFWGYELAALFEPLKFRVKPSWGNVPDLHLGFYRNLVIYDHKARCYYLAAQDKTDQAFNEMKEFVCDPAVVRGLNKKSFKFTRFRAALKRVDFEKAVRKAKSYIAAGDIYQANLSQRFHFDYSGNALELYGALRKINPSPFSAFLKNGSLDIVSSSPERLVSKRGDGCETKPIAGTRPRVRGIERAMTKELLTNAKERAEHLMLVDLERNDLGRVCKWPTVKVNEFMEIEKYSHVMHLVSRITGRLDKGRDVWDLIQAMFPGGTITGCPKIRCMEIIDELEPETRGVYTGSMGYVDFNGDADLNIVIRTLVLKEGRGFYQTGAGIVHDSIPRREYEETLHKGEALKEALRRASSIGTVLL